MNPVSLILPRPTRAVRISRAAGLAITSALAGCAVVGGLGDYTVVDCAPGSVCGAGGLDGAVSPDASAVDGAAGDGGPRDGGADGTVTGNDSGTIDGGQLVVSELYASGGKQGAAYANDYVVLRNVGASPVSLAGASFQHYKTGAGWQVLALTGTSIPAGGTYVIKLFNDGSSQGGAPIPNPAQSSPSDNAWNLSTTNGEAVAIVSSTAALATCTSPSIVDLVGFNSGAPCTEGASPAPTTTAAQAAKRKGAGTQDTNDNGADFELGAPSP
jgi:hypothetical protein